jgi:hypothetical protein
VAEPSSTLAPLEPAAVDGQVARRVARAFLLLEAGVVLLVDHDQPEPRQRGQHRQPRAQHDAAWPGARPASAQALRRRQAAVQRDQADGPAKARAKRASSCGVRLISGTSTSTCAARPPARGGGAQVDLGLAAAGGAVQQETGPVPAQFGQRLHRRVWSR